MKREGRAESSQQAFDRAVDREREAIARHEAAAAHQDRIADQLEQRALSEPDQSLRELGLANAANARNRSERARQRAKQARARLTAEGACFDEPPTDGRTKT